MKKILFLVLVIICALSSCKKHSSDYTIIHPPPVDSFPDTAIIHGMIRMIRSTVHTTYFLYYPNKLLERQIVNGSTTKYTYSNNAIGITSTNDHYYLWNSDSLVYEEGGLVSQEEGLWWRKYFTYNSDRTCKRIKENDPFGTISNIYKYYSSGNEDSLLQYFYPTPYQKSDSLRQSFKYYTNKLNSVTNTNMGQPYFGKSNTNPVKEIYQRTFGGTDSLIATYTYTFDSLDRIILSIKIIHDQIRDTTWIEYY